MTDDRIQQICVGPTDSIRRAMIAIGGGAVDLALVVDGTGRLVGTVTDGDIRRALLGGAGLDDPVGPAAQTKFTAVDDDAERPWVLDLMEARQISQVPVLDADGRVVGLHVLRELVMGRPRDNVAVVMAGGLGSRLGTITESTPKPMLEVAGRPILERIVLTLAGSGIRRICLAVNHRADVIEAFFGDGSAHGCDVTYLRERPETPLGTAGALRLLEPDQREGPPILVMNGDLVVQFRPGDLLDHHALSGASVTAAVRRYEHPVPFGVVDLEDGAVTAIMEKPIEAWWVNAGIYALNTEVIDMIEPDVDFPMPALLERVIASGAVVGAFPLDGDWRDIGRPSDLRAARGDDDG